MKIAYVGTKGIPAKYGGFESCVEKTSDYMARLGYKVIVYSVKERENSQSMHKNIEIRFVPQIGFPTIDRVLREIYPIFLHFKSRNVIFHIYGPYLFMKILRILRIKTILSTDGFEWKRNSYSFLTKKIVYYGYKIGVKNASLVTADSIFVKQWIKQNWKKNSIYLPYGYKRSKLAPKNQILSLKEFNLEKNSYYLFVGRLVPEKGVHLLVKAFLRLKTKKKLVILGADPMRGDPYKNLLKRYANSNIIFLRPMFGEKYDLISSNSYVQVRPGINDSEGSSPVSIESLGFGLCILASDVPQNKEVLLDSAIFFKSNDINDLYEKFLFLENNPDEVKKYRILAKERSVYFSWDKILVKTNKLYKLLNN